MIMETDGAQFFSLHFLASCSQRIHVSMPGYMRAISSSGVRTASASAGTLVGVGVAGANGG
jgi:hypothetical protein